MSLPNPPAPAAVPAPLHQHPVTDWFLADPGTVALYLGGVLLVAWLGNFIVKTLLLRGVEKMLGLLWSDWGRNQHLLTAIRRLANIVPALILMAGVDVIPGLPGVLERWVDNLCIASMALSIALTFSNALDALNHAYERRPEAKAKPIKGYLQITKIVLYIITAVLMISTLINRSPLILLSGLGAITAVLMLIFQDTLLSLVASVQISSGDLVRVGDWIEMPNLNADGDVIDIALHTVKVQNWDKTITTLPTRRLITDPFKNWRGMQESGGRRIKRALFLDQTSVRFLSPSEAEELKRFSLLGEYLEGKAAELSRWNTALGDGPEVNRRRITNLGTFRAYVLNYLRRHPSIHQEMTLLVRQLGPTSDGLPLEIYCFTNDTRWAVYEDIQSDLFDHLLAILPEFGLRVFQNPGGADFRKLAEGATSAESLAG